MMQTNPNQGISPLREGASQPLPQPPLSNLLPVNPNLRNELLTALKDLASKTFERYLPALRQSLSPFNLQVYTRAAKEHPYAQKDWYRDPHDIIVVSAMRRLVLNEGLPPWLVTAAILHDRGYAIMANRRDQTAKEYKNRVGAHWENRDTRLRHSHFSAKYAGLMVFGSSSELRNSFTLQERKLFLKVIKKHDHPLIGEYEKLPEIGRHHFDADSLFSISLISFVKDYLAYCADEKKLQKATNSRICDEEGRFTPNSLLQARLARYYESERDLPSGWSTDKTPLNQQALGFTEGGRCYPPHSPTARTLTNQFFIDLSKCCDLLAEHTSVESLFEVLSPIVSHQFETLLEAEKP